MSITEMLSDRVCFVALTLLLLIFLWIEVRRIRRVHPDRWLLNPVVVCSLLTFVMGYGLTNVLFFLPPKLLYPLGLVPDVQPAMLKLMFLVLLGAVAMYIGYWSPIAGAVEQAQRRGCFSAPVPAAIRLSSRLGVAALGGGFGGCAFVCSEARRCLVTAAPLTGCWKPLRSHTTSRWRRVWEGSLWRSLHSSTTHPGNPVAQPNGFMEYWWLRCCLVF